MDGQPERNEARNTNNDELFEQFNVLIGQHTYKHTFHFMSFIKINENQPNQKNNKVIVSLARSENISNF